MINILNIDTFINMPAEKKNKNQKQKNMSVFDVMDSLMDTNQFNDVKKSTNIGQKNAPVLNNDMGINLETDKPEEIIKKLVAIVRKQQIELEEFKTHSEGTYCTLTEFNRSSLGTETRIDELSQRLDLLEMDD